METFSATFPRHGKLFSTRWKKRADFSTPWKLFPRIFHAMETCFPPRGKSGKRVHRASAFGSPWLER